MRSARRSDRVCLECRHPQNRDRVGRTARHVLDERRLERGVRELVHAQRAHERVTTDRIDPAAPARDDARLRSTEQLVAAEAHHVRARLEHLLNAWFGVQRSGRIRRGKTAAEVFDERQLEPVRQRREVGERCSLDEPFDAEVGRMHAQDCRGAVADRQCVVVQSRPVRRAHFAKLRARLRHHIRHAEAAADLDELGP